MKTWICLIVILSLIFKAQSIKIKDPESRVFFQFSDHANPGSLFKNSEICEGLVDFLKVFGTDAVSSYKTCPEQYVLLGEENSLIKEDQPSCYLNLVSALCQYRVDTDIEHPHPNDLRFFITKTIQNCIKTKSEYTNEEAYICPTLNFQTQQVEEKEDFCKNLEAMNQYDPDQESEPTYKVYGFIGKDAITPCVEIVELYNFCIFVSRKLNLDSEMCFTNKFTLYEDGGIIQKLGSQDQNICATMMLPYFSYNSVRQNILDPMNSFGFCDQINNGIILELEARQQEIKVELSYLRGNQSIYEGNIEKINTLKTHIPLIVDGVSKIEEQWTSLFKLLTNHETVNATNVTVIVKNNVDLLNNTLADWVMTSRSSLEFIKSFSNNATDSLLNYNDQVTDNFNKIHLLSNHTLNFATFTNQLMANNVSDNSADNMVSGKADNTIFTKNLKAENVLFYEGKTNYGNFLTKFMGQTSTEIQNNEDKVKACKNQIEVLTKNLDAVYEQEQLSYKYFY